ncbi:BglG family transcription antiterminator [Lactovum odontotermitis]
MESRISELFQLICKSEKTYSIAQLSALFKVNNRTIVNDIEKINDYLRKKKLTQIVIDNKRISHPVSLSLSFAEILNHRSELLFLDAEFRRKQILLDALLDLEHFSIENLGNRYLLSRNTIIKDIKEIRNVLLNQGIQLTPVPFKGYLLTGDEVTIRKLAASLFSIAKVNVFESENLECLMSQMDHFLSDLFKKLERRVAENAFERLLAYFWISCLRTEKNHFLPLENTGTRHPFEKECLLKTDGFCSLFKNIEQHPAELEYLSNKIAEASLLNSDEPLSDDWLSWSFITIDLINNVSEITRNAYFKSDHTLFNGLLLHLKPAMNRLKNGEDLSNPLYQEVLGEFNRLNEAVLLSLPPLEMKLGIKFTAQEATFLTLFFAASIQRESFQEQRVKNVIVVCSEGISSSQILSSRLQSFFDFNIIGTFSKREVLPWLETHQADLMISTVALSSAKCPTIKVNPMLSIEDIEKIQQMTNVSLRKISIDDILSAIKENVHLTAEQEDSVYSSLGTLLRENSANGTVKSEADEPALSELLTLSVIRAHFSAKDCREAVREAGRILVENGIAENSYIEGMMKNIEHNSSYIVILPGIALPHSSPENGALKIGFSLVTLKDSVEFGHSNNNPVRLVIGLSAIDHQNHLKALSELVDLLCCQKTVDQIIAADTSEEIYSVIENKIKRKEDASEQRNSTTF